jgi:hypothetical protein
MLDLVDRERQDKIEKRDRRGRDRELSDLRFVCKSVEGRRMCMAILEDAGIFRDAFCGDQTNRTNYNLGRQSVGRNLYYDLLEACPDRVLQMQQEKDAEEKINDIIEEKEQKSERGII